MSDVLLSGLYAMHKTAVPAWTAGAAHRALGAGSSAAMGAVGGAALGGLLGGVMDRNPDPATGEPAPSLTHRVLRGAGRGALLGGGLGGLHGAITPTHLTDMGRKGAIGALSRFGQRQVHSLTGALPAVEGGRSKAYEALRMGVHDLRTQLDSVTKELSAATDKGTISKLTRHKASLERAIPHMQKVEEYGMTSVPGLFKSLVTKPISAVHHGAASQWYGSPGVVGKALNYGLPAATVYGAIRGSEGQPYDPNMSAVERGARAVGQSVPFLLAPVPITGALAAGTLMEHGLGGASRLALKHHAAPPAQEYAYDPYGGLPAT